MISKIYISANFFVTTVIGSYLSVLLGELTLTVIGFVVATLFFLGIIALLPSLLNKHYSAER